MVLGTIYGLILNDCDELASLTAASVAVRPVAPVMYIKPRTCVTTLGAPVLLPECLDEVEVAPTLGLLFDDGGCLSAACLALEVSERHRDYLRPAIRERCRDGFLPLGRFAALPPAIETAVIDLAIDGAAVFRWPLTRLARPIPKLVADVRAFITLDEGDLLLVGLPAGAPVAKSGARIRVTSEGLPPLEITIRREVVA